MRGSDEWVELYDDVKSKAYYWNRRTRSSSWLPPEGIKVVWVGMRNAEGEVYYWHRVTRVSSWASPHPFMGATSGRITSWCVVLSEVKVATFIRAC